MATCLSLRIMVQYTGLHFVPKRTFPWFYFSLWLIGYNDNVESLLKVTYNRVFRILLRLEHRISMSANFIRRELELFPVIVGIFVLSFRRRVLASNKLLIIRAFVDSDYYVSCSLASHWNSMCFCHWIMRFVITILLSLFLLNELCYVYMHLSYSCSFYRRN